MSYLDSASTSISGSRSLRDCCGSMVEKVGGTLGRAMIPKTPSDMGGGGFKAVAELCLGNLVQSTVTNLGGGEG